MRMLVLGAGQQGTSCAYDLLTRTEHDVVLADLDVTNIPDFLQPFVGDRLTLQTLDANDSDAIRRVVAGAAATMSALPYYFNLELAKAAVEAGSHYCDLGGNTQITMDQKALHDEAVSRGVSIIADCGLAPGMVNILAADGVARLDQAREVYIKVGGLPQNPVPPINYQVVYSLEGALDYYTTLSWILRDGRAQEVSALSEVEAVEFDGVGELEAFHTAGGLSMMAQTYEGKLERMEYKTLRYPGHAAAMEVIRELGLLSLEPVEVRGQQVVPRDLFIAAATPVLRRDPRESPDLVALRVEAEGTKDGRDTLVRYDLVDRYDAATGITAMMRTTGYSLAITGLLQAEGEIRPGAWTPDEVVPAGRYIAALAERGVNIEVTER